MGIAYKGKLAVASLAFVHLHFKYYFSDFLIKSTH